MALEEYNIWSKHILWNKIVFTTDVIANIVKNLDSNKSHGHDNVSIHMLKICGFESANLLKLFLELV